MSLLSSLYVLSVLVQNVNQKWPNSLGFNKNTYMIHSSFFPRDLLVAKFSPEWVTGPEQGKSSGRIATFRLWTGMFRDGISSIPGVTVIPL